jgi:hypothetical protein
MPDTNDKTSQLHAAVQFLLDEHLKGEPVDDSAKVRFQTAQSHKDALAPVEIEVSEAKVEAPKPPTPQAPPTPQVPQAPQIPSVS